MPTISAMDSPATAPAREISAATVGLTAALVTLVQLVARSICPFPYALHLDNLALSFLLYAVTLIPALIAARMGPRYVRLAYLLLGTPFGLLAMRLLFVSGAPSRNTLIAVGLLGFPAGLVLQGIGSTRRLATATALCLVLGAGVRLRPPTMAGSRTPSVLFIVLDTTGTGHLSAYGYSRPTTPALDALARRALVYRRAVSPASWTLPAHASIFSGLYPSELGFDGLNFTRDPAVGSLAGDVEASGRTAYAISANPLVVSDGMLRVGYRAMWEGDHLTRAFPLMLLDAIRAHEHFLVRGDDITNLALDWVDRLAPRDRSWFLFLNYIDPHMPYCPPQRERDAFAPGVDPDAIAHFSQAYSSGQVRLTPAVAAAMRALYDGEVAAMDRALGRLFDGLEQRGYDANNLLIVVTADHGEALGEHGLIGHLRGLPDTVLHVPLLIAGPGVTPGEVTTPVQTVQLRATVRALLGLPPMIGIAPALPPWGRGPSLLITEHPEPRWYFEDLRSRNGQFDPEPWAGDWVAVERDGLKVVFDDHGRGRAYRLKDDPAEDLPLPLTDGMALSRAYAAWRAHDRYLAQTPPDERQAFRASTRRDGARLPNRRQRASARASAGSRPSEKPSGTAVSIGM